MSCFIFFAITDVFKKDLIFLPMFSASIMLLFILQKDPTCCVTIAPHGDQLLLMNNPRPCRLWNVSQVLGQWSPVALFWSCLYDSISDWASVIQQQQQSPCLEDLIQMNLVVCVFFKRASRLLTYCHLDSDFHISLEWLML